MFRNLFQARSDLYPLVFRLTFGLIMFLHGAQKAFGWFGGSGWAATVARMAPRYGDVIPHLVIFGETFGGLALMLGLLTRVAAAGNAIIMAGAVFLVKFSKGFFNARGGFEYPLLLLIIALHLTWSGADRFSLDARLFGIREH